MSAGEPASSAPLAAFRGPVGCSRCGHALILSGAAADSADDRLILTLIRPSIPDIPLPLSAISVSALDGGRYRIASGSGDLLIEAAAVHLHRDIGRVFYRAVAPRPAPLGKRLFWRLVLSLAGSRAGKRLLASLRHRA